MLRRSIAVALLFSVLFTSTRAFAQQPTAQPSPTPATPGAPQTAAQAAASPTPARDPNDPFERIKDEGMNRSQLMQTLTYLTDVIGPRLTASPNMKRANEWTRDRLTSWGLENAHLEAWGPFGRGWTLRNFSAQVVEPQDIPLIAYPKAWSPGLKGQLVADVIYVDAKTEAELEQYRGKLRGAIVLTAPPPEVKARFEAPGRRLDEKDLLRLADALDPRTTPARRNQFTPEQRAAAQLLARKYRFFTDEGAALLVDPSRAGDGGTIFVQSATVPQPFVENPNAPGAPRRINAYDKDAPPIVPQIVLAVEHYNRLLRILRAGERVRMAVNLDVQFHDADPMGYNTVAEIQGSDLKDELVMLGGHMDSWHSGTGATDNAAGVAVAMEAVRILKALHMTPRRTIRIGLWSGEEQGLLGSKAYVTEHFGKVEPTPTPAPASSTPPSPPLMTDVAPIVRSTPKILTKPGYEKFSAYFNLDNGTGKIRGVYLQGNEAARPLFRDWLVPFRDLGAQTLSIANTGGTDHLSFDGIGLPGFQFIQDPVEYDTRTHHSNQDVLDRIQPEDLKQAATIMAAFIWNAAVRDERVPRKPLANR